MRLVDMDALNVPMLAADPYGNFIPGPLGLPQYVTRAADCVEGDLAEHRARAGATSATSTPRS